MVGCAFLLPLRFAFAICCGKLVFLEPNAHTIAKTLLLQPPEIIPGCSICVFYANLRGKNKEAITLAILKKKHVTTYNRSFFIYFVFEDCTELFLAWKVRYIFW